MICCLELAKTSDWLIEMVLRGTLSIDIAESLQRTQWIVGILLYDDAAWRFFNQRALTPFSLS